MLRDSGQRPTALVLDLDLLDLDQGCGAESSTRGEALIAIKSAGQRDLGWAHAGVSVECGSTETHVTADIKRCLSAPANFAGGNLAFCKAPNSL